MEKSLEFVKSQSGPIRIWGCMSAVVLILFLLTSDFDFSMIITLSSLISCFSLGMVAWSIESAKSCRGLSLKMCECYAIVFFLRVIAVMRYQGYLPQDRSGDWLYQLSEAFCLGISLLLVYYGHYKYTATYNPKLDGFQNLLILVPCAVLAFFFHPNLNNNFIPDFSWTLALYIESMAVLPQLFYFQRDRTASPVLSHFLAAQALSKLISFFFWITSHGELNDETNFLKYYSGIWVVVAQISQLVIMGDFIYKYLQCVGKGVSVSNIFDVV